jgi:hypothetical protein
MPNAAFRVAEQHGEFGFYAEVELSVMPVNALSLTVCHRDISGDWEAAVQFGLSYAWDHLRARAKCGFSVEVVSLETHPVDSSHLLVAYVAAMALFKAAGYTGPGVPVFHKEARTVVFLK